MSGGLTKQENRRRTSAAAAAAMNQTKLAWSYTEKKEDSIDKQTLDIARLQRKRTIEEYQENDTEQEMWTAGFRRS